MLIAIFSDIHIHSHSSSIDKLHDCLNCLDWIYRICIKKNVKNIIFLGDLLHERHKINVYAYCHTYDILEKYQDQIKSYFVLGNHDLFYRTARNVSAVKPFSKIVEVISDPQTIEIDGLKIDCLPYTEKVSDDLKSYFPNPSQVLAGHIALNGAVVNQIYNVKFKQNDLVENIQETPIELLKNYKKVFLGHFHSKQKINDVIEYIGSPLQLSYGEAMEEKGITFLNTENLQTSFIENKKSPKYFILPYDTDLKQYNIENNYVHLIAPRLSNLDSLELKKSIEFNFKPKELKIIHHSTEEEQITINEQVKSISSFSAKTSDLINEYVNSIDSILDKEMLKKIGIEITQELQDDIKETNS